MGVHLIDGQFQSDKYPSTPRGKVPLSVKDKTAQDLLWEYAQRRRSVDAEFSDDLEQALLIAGYDPQLHTGDLVQHRQTGMTGTVTGFAHDGTDDVLVNQTGPYPQKDLQRIRSRS